MQIKHNKITGAYYETKDRSNLFLLVAVAVMISACWIIYYYTYGQEKETDGCVASAYQATKYGQDLEANLAECK